MNGSELLSKQKTPRTMQHWVMRSATKNQVLHGLQLGLILRELCIQNWVGIYMQVLVIWDYEFSWVEYPG